MLRFLNVSIISIVLVFTNSLVNESKAHDRAALAIDSAGIIDGVPDFLQPTVLDLKKGVFHVKDKTFSFPDCLSPYIEGELLEVRGTWYHYPTDEPPHVEVVIRQNETQAHMLVLSLLDARPLALFRAEKVEELKLKNKPVALDVVCTEAF